MGPPSYMRSVVDRNVVIRRMTVTASSTYLPVCTSLPSSWELQDGFKEPFLTDCNTAPCAVSLQLLTLRTQLNTVLCAGALSPQTADNRRRT
jgi:hypothetical protein